MSASDLQKGIDKSLVNKYNKDVLFIIGLKNAAVRLSMSYYPGSLIFLGMV